QTFFGTPIYGTNCKININKSGKVSNVLYKLANTQNWPKKKFSIKADSSKIKTVTANYIISEIKYFWFFDGLNIQQAFVAEYGETDGTFHQETVISADYHILYNIDKHRYSG